MPIYSGVNKMGEVHIGSTAIAKAYVGTTQVFTSAYVFNPIYSTNQTDVHVRDLAIADGWDAIEPLNATITVESGVILYSTSTSVSAFNTGTTFPEGSKITLINQGVILGKGGLGGWAFDRNGAAGGGALQAKHAITIDNAGGRIAGGGGGGEGAEKYVNPSRSHSAGGGGIGNGGGGGEGGHAGTLTAAGTTSPVDASVATSQGGYGGGYGASGNNAIQTDSNPRVPGAGGYAVSGNSFITWIDVGTRNGTIS